MSEPSDDRPSGSTIFLVAAEESGDRLGAALMQTLKLRSTTPIHFAGIGGRDMAAEGLDSMFSIHEIGNMGIGPVVRRLPSLIRKIRAVSDATIALRPDILVIIDSPDFTHRVARRVRRYAPTIPIIDYVAPSVWAWRPGRARAMRHYVDHVLALLPFEPAVFARLGGPTCSYVGHPLIDEIERLRPNKSEALRRLADPPIVLALPGSRTSEIRRLAEPFGEALARVRDCVGAFNLVLPTVPHLVEVVTPATANWPVQPRIVTDTVEKRTAFRSARAALAKSGTITLELALAGIPMVTAYKLSGFEAMIARRVISVSSVILANLVLDENVVPELLQTACTPKALADALIPLMTDSPQRRRQTEAFARLDAIMAIGQAAPSEHAAEIVLELAMRARSR